MSNGIASRQNKEENLIYLSAQRQIYSDLKSISKLQFLFCIMITVALSIMQLLINNPIIIIINFCVTFFVFLFNIRFERYIKKQQEIAAYIQQIFDVDVYTMKWVEGYFCKKKNVDSDISIKSNKYIQKFRNFDDFKNWYSIPYDALPLNIGTYYCQKESITWDKKLRKITKWVYLSLIFLLGISIIIYCVMSNKLAIDMIFIMVIFSPLFQYCISKINNLSEDIIRIDEMFRQNLCIEEIIETSGEIEEYEIYNLQKLIYEHRKSCLPISDFIYKLFKNKYQNEASLSANYIKKNTK
jgi:hypothetical protein